MSSKYADRPFIADEVRRKLEGYPELLQELLIARNITNEADAEAFLSPDYDAHVHDPFLMKDMDRAVDRVLRAIKENEHIVIYSDYDCDGIPGGVMLHDFFTLIGYKEFSNYIPHRHDEGYGLNAASMDTLKERGAALVITVDSGITDTEAVERANALEMDVIVTDHHLPAEALPPAYAVLNPKQEGDTYPDPMLCGTGVAFKLVQGILARNRFGVKEGKEKWLLDLVGLATIADMVPLRNENRVFAYYGLQVMRKSPRPGIQKLCRKMRMDQRHITEDDIGFMIAPRINAASRMGEPMEAFKLLATRDEAEAGVQAEHLNKINDQRKGVVASMAREIKKRLQERGELKEVIVIGDPRWKPALLGLAANSLVEEYARPVFVWGREGNDTIKGSCRSDGSVDVVQMMAHAGDALQGSGGHMLAGGFSVLHDAIHTLEDRLVAAYRAVKNDSVIQNSITIDRRLTLDEVNWETYRAIERLAPFGEGNPKPIFLFPEVVVDGARSFGRDKTHLEVTFKNSAEKPVTAIQFFNTTHTPDTLAAGAKINLVATLEKSMFRRFPELRLRIVDIY